MKNNNAPFHPNQRVVALGDSEAWKEGDEFIVLSLRKPCCQWQVDVGKVVPFDADVSCDCGYKEFVPRGGTWFANAKLFAPIREVRDHKRVAVPEELLHIVEREIR